MGAQISNPLDITPTALRVLKVFPNSPCFKAGIEPFFDYILSLHIDNILTPFSDVFSYNESLILSHFFDIITKNVNKPVGLTIFSVYTQEKRYLEVIPSRDWPNSDSLLGILIRNEEIANALERTFKVLSVLPGSPAFLSGLIAEEDYILGLTFHKYKGIRDFKDILTQNTGKTHEICVFNQKSRDIKYITLQPNKDWGGEGIIGCEFGFGGMNQLKIGLENVKNSNEFFEKKEEKLGIEDKLIEKVEKTSVLTKNSILQSNKLRIPPKNPFNYPLYHKKPSFEKNLADKG